MTLVLYILAAKEIFYVYEQPGSSLLWCHPRMEEFFQRNMAYRVWTWMGAFGAKSPKGSVLVSSCKDIMKLCRPLPQRQWVGLADKTTKQGKVTVSGNKFLKSSQEYTPAFGRAILSTWLGVELAPELAWDTVRKPDRVWKTLRSKADRWDDANLDEVFVYLTPC